MCYSNFMLFLTVTECLSHISRKNVDNNLYLYSFALMTNFLRCFKIFTCNWQKERFSVCEVNSLRQSLQNVLYSSFRSDTDIAISLENFRLMLLAELAHRFMRMTKQSRFYISYFDFGKVSSSHPLCEATFAFFFCQSWSYVVDLHDLESVIYKILCLSFCLELNWNTLLSFKIETVLYKAITK